jgi:hypothetical protein
MPALSPAVSLLGTVGGAGCVVEVFVAFDVGEALSGRPPLVPDIAQIIKTTAKQTTAIGRMMA